MAKRSFICNICGKETKITSLANFTIYCPKCKKIVHAECEYGYGPVTPYYFLVGDDEIAKVDDIGLPPRYILYLKGEEIPLKKRYFDAIKEVDKMLSERYGLTGFTSKMEE